mmetsp:Transcript_147529/g.456348  ORF Transcript_147529/g.456348 Transcript_147529/m.456348 type:complete len:89 (-) Transcript_147529:369-635(-)
MLLRTSLGAHTPLSSRTGAAKRPEAAPTAGVRPSGVAVAVEQQGGDHTLLADRREAVMHRGPPPCLVGGQARILSSFSLRAKAPLLPR